jgi:hypothetical protein
LPLEELIIKVGLPDPFDSPIITSDVSNLVRTVTILIIWLVMGTVIATALLFVSTSRPGRTPTQIVRST